VGIQTKAGIVIATEKRVASKLLAPPKTSEKVYKLDEHVRGRGGWRGRGGEGRLGRGGGGGACGGATFVGRALSGDPHVHAQVCLSNSLLPAHPPCPQIFAAVAGLTSDANILVQYARTAAQRYR
jgi:hypothetical protein